MGEINRNLYPDGGAPMGKRDPQIHRMLLSTTSRLVGEYESSAISITLAWPDIFGRIGQPETGMEANPYSRNYLVLSLEIEDPPAVEGRLNLIPNYSYLGE